MYCYVTRKVGQFLPPRGFKRPSPFFLPLRCDVRDIDFATLTKAHHALSIIIENAQKEAEQAKNLAKKCLCWYLSLTLMLVVPSNPYQLWSP
jgi:hypothetical protein